MSPQTFWLKVAFIPFVALFNFDFSVFQSVVGASHVAFHFSFSGCMSMFFSCGFCFAHLPGGPGRDGSGFDLCVECCTDNASHH